MGILLANEHFVSIDSEERIRKLIIPIKTTNDDELYFDTPTEMIEELGLRDGDRIIWTVHKDGVVIISKPSQLKVSKSKD